MVRLITSKATETAAPNRLTESPSAVAVSPWRRSACEESISQREIHSRITHAEVKLGGWQNGPKLINGFALWDWQVRVRIGSLSVQAVVVNTLCTSVCSILRAVEGCLLNLK